MTPHHSPLHILITGATDGLGKALAALYVARGHRLILVGRRPLSELPPPMFNERTYCQSDLSRPESPQQIVEWLDRQGITRLDRVVHNAGVGSFGAIAQQPQEEIDALLAVNLLAPISLTHALLPHLRAAHGTLVFVSSVASRLPTPEYAVYGATKAALNEFARALRLELEGEVEVTLLLPGATRTGLHEKSGVPRDAIKPDRLPSADRVAVQMLAAIEGAADTATFGLGNQLLGWAGQHAAPLVDRLQERRQ